MDALADRVQVLPAENEGTPGGSGCGRTQGTAGWLPRLPPPTPEQMAKLNALATQRLQAGRRRVVLRYYPKPRDSNARRRVVVVRRTPSEETTQTDSGGRVVVCRGWSETKPVEVQPDVCPEWFRFVPSLNRAALYENRDVYTLRDVLPPESKGYSVDVDRLGARNTSTRPVVVCRREGKMAELVDPNGGLVPSEVLEANEAPRGRVVVVNKLQTLARH